MPLMEHIRELRNRVVKVAVALTVGSVIGWVVYPRGLELHQEAVLQGADLVAGRVGARAFGGKLSPHCQLFVSGIFDPLFLKLQISIAVGVIISSPVWLYQFWAFIAPGLYRRERRWAYYFVGAALPLFAVGATIAYFAMTRGLEFLLQPGAGRHDRADHDQHVPELRRGDAHDLRHRL